MIIKPTVLFAGQDPINTHNMALEPRVGEPIKEEKCFFWKYEMNNKERIVHWMYRNPNAPYHNGWLDGKPSLRILRRLSTSKKKQPNHITAIGLSFKANL